MVSYKLLKYNCGWYALLQGRYRRSLVEDRRMNEMKMDQNTEVEVDLQRLVGDIWKKRWLVMCVAVLCAVLTLVGTILFITPEYESAAMFYVNNNALSLGDTSLSISSGDLTTSRNLVDSYLVILDSRESLTAVIDYAGVNRSVKEVRKMISAAAVNETEIFEVVVTSTDPQEAEKIASAIAYILPKRISSIIEGTSAKVVDSAVVPVKPSSPSYTRNTFIGALLGVVLVVMVIAIKNIFGTLIRTEEDISQCCKYPVLASVPDMVMQDKGGYNYSYDRKKPDAKSSGTRTKAALMGRGMSFSASESYKLLRTKLQFSFADEATGRVIGVSSAMSGEGKSLTSVNLAYSLAELDQKVLLIDCDMRRPTLAEKLKIQKKPGLSSLLTGQSSLEELIQYCGIQDDENAFQVIAAGQNPPNPIELLSSEKMKKTLEELRRRYDYIILDLPPVGEVSDAMSVAKQMDGVLLVVRQNYGDRIALMDTVRQFEFVDARILGVVYNCTNEAGGKYNKYYYRKYHKSYGKH